MSVTVEASAQNYCVGCVLRARRSVSLSPSLPPSLPLPFSPSLPPSLRLPTIRPVPWPGQRNARRSDALQLNDSHVAANSLEALRTPP